MGYDDLDDQGSWRTMPDYGPVWYPNSVAAGWAPYQSGHWSYIAPWGYTWVDDQPWGFAPFHYGRWIWGDGSWGWIPCPPRPERGGYIRPVYAPALVAWVGAGATIAWFALGPHEVFVPSYPVSANYVRNINVSNTTVNTTVINNIYNTTIINNKTVNVTYINRAAPGAITATSNKAFTTAQPVARNLVKVDPRELSTARVRAVAPAIVPTKQAVLGSSRVVDNKPPTGVLTRAVVARTPPPAPAPSFEARESAIRSNGGKPLSIVQVRQLQRAATARAAPIRVAARTSAPIKPPAATDKVSGQPPSPHAVARTSPRTEMPISHPAPTAIHASELPTAPKTTSPKIADSALEREQLQQQQQMRAQQAQERQRMQQQQDLAHQKLANEQADAARKQELEKQHQQQTQDLQHKHIEEQQALKAKQQEEAQAAKSPVAYEPSETRKTPEKNKQP